MPSSGFPIEPIRESPAEQMYIDAIQENAKHALKTGMFIEWLECFVGAYNEQLRHNPEMPKWEAANIASQAGIIEWDM